MSSVRKDVSEELSVSKTAQAVSDAYTSKTKLTDDLEQYLADVGKPVSATELGVDGAPTLAASRTSRRWRTSSPRHKNF